MQVIFKNLPRLPARMIVFVLIASWIFLGWPQTWHNQSASLEIENAEAAEIKNFGSKSINFFYSDDNSNENLIIKTDKKTYIGLTQAEVYFSVTNIGDKSEMANFQIYFPEDSGQVKKIVKWTENIAYQIDVPEYGPKIFSCEQEWEEITDEEAGVFLGQYECALTEEIMVCDSLSEDGRNCILDKIQIGFHKEIKYKNNWQAVGLSDSSLPIRQGFFSKLFNLGIKRKPVPQNFKVKKSASHPGGMLGAGETQYYKMEIQFPPNSANEFYIEAIGDKKGYGLLDPWWNSSWQYKMPIIIDNTGNSNSLSDYQVLVEATSTLSDFWSHVKSDGGDVRFVNANEDTELDFLNLYFNHTDDKALYWVKVDSIESASSTLAIYMYYGNGGASSASSAEDAFSYTTKVDRFFALGNYNPNQQAKGITFFDNNDFEIGGLADTDWDTGSSENPKTISNSYTGDGENAQATKPFAITGDASSCEMWSPLAWQSKLFVTTFPRSDSNFFFYNPSASTASITVYKSGVSQENFNLVAGVYVEKTSYTHTNFAHWRIESDYPILVFQDSGSSDNAVLPPPVKIWHGIIRNTRVMCSEDNTSVTIYFSDGTSESNADCDATEVWTVAKSGAGNGGAPSGRLVADKPVYILSYADADGSEMQAWYADEDLDTEHLVPDSLEYLSCSAPYHNTTITVYDMAGTEQATSGNLGSSHADGYPYHWLDSTDRSGGMRIFSNNPIYCYYDQYTGGDENNIANRVINRKGTWPRPFVSSIGSEEESTEPVLTQNYYRWYVNTDNITPTDAWPSGATNLGENAAITSSYAVSSGNVLRLRISLQISNANLGAVSQAFKLQYGQGSDCSAISTWTDVDSISGSDIWRGYNNATPADGATLSSALLSVSDVVESYEEANNSASNPNAVNISQDGEWDWVIENNSAPANTEYCFRMVKSNGDAFNCNNYPKLITNTPPNTPTQTKLFDNQKTATTTPAFEFSATDSSSDDLIYQIEWDTDYDFGSAATKSSDSDAGFENLISPADTNPFNSGDNIRFTIQSGDALSNNTTYWWRIRVKDPNGANEWSGWSNKRSFSVDSSVTAFTWFQTTDEQFDTDTLNNTVTTGSDSIEMRIIIGEYGTASLTDNSWSQVNLNNSYDNLITAASARYAANSDTARAPRVRSKGSTSFEIKVDNYNSTLTGNTTVDWIAMEQGSWSIVDGGTGTKVIANTKNVSTVYCRSYSDSPGELVSFSPNFDGSPAMLHIISSNNDSGWVVSHIDSGSTNRQGEPTSSQMGLGLGRSYDNCTHSAEDIDYIGFDTGHGTNNSVDFDAIVGTDTVSCCSTTGYSTSYSSAFSSAPEVMVIGQMGEDGGDGSWGSTHTGTSPSATVHYGTVDEDGPSADRSHTTESVGVVAFDASSGDIYRYGATTGNVISTAIDYNDGTGSSWGQLSWNDNETNGDIKYQVQYWDGDSWELIPDGALSGNSTGFDDSPVNLSGLNTTTYNQIKIKANFTYSGGSAVLQDWTVSWAAPAVSISLTTDGSISFDTLSLNQTEDTTASGINDVETVSVDSGPADLDIRSSNFTEGGNVWTLGSSNGSNQVKWEFSKDGDNWITFVVAESLYTLENNVGQGQTRNVYLRITMPTVTDSYDEYGTTVTIVASEP